MNFNKNKQIKIKKDVLLNNKNDYINLKKLNFSIKKCIGRDKYGQLMYHRGGGVKKLYKLLHNPLQSSFYRILQIQYDSYRSCFINLIQYKNGALSYCLAFSKSELNQIINNFDITKITCGMYLPLYNIPSKSLIYNVELIPGSGGTIGKAGGSFCKLFRKESDYGIIILPSGKKKKLSLNCKAFVGIPSNSYKKLNKKYKAGTVRYLNRRPVVRGVAMNPVDHPHGGGEGKSTSGRSCVSPWGKLTKNVPTRKKKKKNYDKI